MRWSLLKQVDFAFVHSTSLVQAQEYAFFLKVWKRWFPVGLQVHSSFHFEEDAHCYG